MTSILTEAQTWLAARYQAAGLALPAFRWVRRDAPRTGSPAPADALLVEDPELRLLLLLLELDGQAPAEALAGQVPRDLQAAWELRSACLPGEGPGLPGAAESWRVALHWLGGSGQENAWRAAILHARQDHSLLEEIAVDATFRNPQEALGPILDQGGFPSLLLATRQVFRMDAGATDLWASADSRVRQATADLEAAFREPRARELARWLQTLAQTQPPAAGDRPARPPRRLGIVSVQNVRGVRSLTLQPWPGRQAVQAWVVSGPNGSGKSSLAEAVALKAFGASGGLCAFLRDPDVAKARTPEGYLRNYLAPVAGGDPRCGLDGPPEPLALAPDLDTALEAMAEAEGTIAAQGSAAGFLDLPGDELGARMARSFSALAQRLEARVEAGRKAAGEQRTALARKHGIGSGVRLATTFQDRIARAALAAALPPLPPAAAAFLACRAALPGAAGQGAGRLRDAWAAGPGLDAVVKDLLRLRLDRGDDPETVLLPILAGQENRTRELNQLLAGFRSSVQGLPAPPQGLAAAAARWAEWLARPQEAPTAAPPPQPAPSALDALLAERAALAEQGRAARPLHDHLEQALAFIRAHWQDQHPQDCPTCGSHLSGPVAQAAAALLAEAQAHLARQREAYAELTRRIKELEGRPAAGPGQGCPLPLEARQQLQAAAAALLGPEADAAQLLAGAFRPALEQLLAFAEAPPAELPVTPAADAAAACAGTLRAGWREAEQALAEPEAWEQLARELTRRLAGVVAEHLPATLETLWRELAASLSPAPWLLPARPRFQPRTVRGANRVEVVLEAPDFEPRLARHLLNDAQLDTLGLAWTFCQHLVRARFQHAWMLLDDPARDMDQPAYRAFCRFLASLLGLYRSGGLPFTLVLLLNQEDRAMDAARETGQGLILLGWSGRQEDAGVKRVALFGEATRSPQPGDLWDRTAG